MLNIFATWCGPCRNEFPEMVKSCEERKDQVEVLLIDRDHINGDNAEKVKKFVEEMGLPFRAAYEDETVIGTLARFNSYPVTIVIDRFGKICYVRELCFFNKGEIDRVLDTFLGDDYKESVLLTEVPGEKIDVAYWYSTAIRRKKTFPLFRPVWTDAPLPPLLEAKCMERKQPSERRSRWTGRALFWHLMSKQRQTRGSTACLLRTTAK